MLVRLEKKSDFLEGFCIYKDDKDKIQKFKIIFKELARDFFQDYVLIYLFNTKKVDDMDIHLRCIVPLLNAINDPKIFDHFKPYY